MLTKMEPKHLGLGSIMLYTPSIGRQSTPGESRGRKATDPRLLRDAGLQASFRRY